MIRPSEIMKKEIDILERLHHHCCMFLYVCNTPVHSLINPIAMDVNIFTIIHLAATMFIVKDSRSDSRGGLFFRSLNSVGLDHLL